MRRRRLNGIPLHHVRRVLARERADLRDVYRPLSALRLEVRDPTAPLPDRYQVITDRAASRLPLRLAPTAIEQLASLAGVPSAFLEKVPPALGLKLLRCMLDLGGDGADKPLLLRLVDGAVPRIRAILPQSFARFDDIDVLHQVSSVAERSHLRVVSMTVNDDLFWMRLVSPETVDLGHAGYPDPALAGFDMRASETGVYPLEVRHLLLRIVCENGATVLVGDPRQQRARHTRTGVEHFKEVLLGAADGLEEHGREAAAHLRETRRAHVKDPVAEVDAIFRRFRLGNAKGKLGSWVLAELLKRETLFGVQRFDLVQAFTAAAKGLDHPTRVRFEDAMGAYLMEDAA